MGTDAVEPREKTDGTKNSSVKAASSQWWKQIGNNFENVKAYPYTVRRPLMDAISAITILALAGMAGATGAYLSTLMRILGVAESSQLGRNLTQFQNSGTAVYLAPLLGAIFATVLSGIFAAKVVRLDVFPQLKDSSPWFSLFYYTSDFAKWMIWAFIAGFSERLVPDMLDRLTARAQGNGAKAQPVITSTTASLKIDGPEGGRRPPTMAPQNVQLVRQADGKWKATWDAVQGADKYILSKKLEGTDQEFVDLPKVTAGTETVIENLPVTGKLKFQVKARNSAGVDGPAGTVETDLS
jgi:hypothetical protein